MVYVKFDWIKVCFYRLLINDSNAIIESETSIASVFSIIFHAETYPLIYQFKSAAIYQFKSVVMHCH